jgi:hypothetical protein
VVVDFCHPNLGILDALHLVDKGVVGL